MRIAFVGKGGSGKTTFASLFTQHLVQKGLPVLAIDADINQHLGHALGADKSLDIPAMGNEIGRIKEYFRGSNKLIPSNATMTKTSPPGNGSHLLKLSEENPITDYFSSTINGVRLMATGPFTEEDIGIKCYHSKTGAVELLLNHMIDQPDEYVILDMTAGADSFASGLFTKFDLTILVVEPTLKSVSVFEQYKSYAQDYDIVLKVVGNKIMDEDDEQFVKDAVGEHYISGFAHSPFVRSIERGDRRELVGFLH